MATKKTISIVEMTNSFLQCSTIISSAPASISPYNLLQYYSILAILIIMLSKTNISKQHWLFVSLVMHIPKNLLLCNNN